MASSVSDITSSNTYHLHYILPPVMVHTSRSYQYTSYEEFRDNGMFPSETHCMQFLYDMNILRTHQKCPSCNIPMTLTECSTTKYRDGCCWKCSCERTTAPRVRSVLQQSCVTYGDFGKILAYFSKGKSVKTAAKQANLAENTVRRFFNKIHNLRQFVLAEDVTTKTKIGGVGTVVEVGWKSYINLGLHGYVHMHVNLSEDFVNPSTGANNNLIEGTWTHAKYKAFRRVGRKTDNSLRNNLFDFMSRKQKQLTGSVVEAARQIFSKEIPSLLYYMNF